MIRRPPRSTLFPYTRSSDLHLGLQLEDVGHGVEPVALLQMAGVRRRLHAGLDQGELRSEEHTSELQSQSNLVCRLLLEKKKKEKHHTTNSNNDYKELMYCDK